MNQKEISQRTMNTRGPETLVQILLTIHYLCMAAGALRYSTTIFFSMLFLLMTSWIVFFSKSIEYKTRAIITAFLVQINICLYTITADVTLSGILLPFLALVVIVGIYGISTLIILSLIPLAFIVIYNCFVVEKINVFATEYVYTHGILVYNSFFIILILYIWVKNRNINEQAIDDVIQELKDAEQAKDDFLANVSHEIRTPINTITGMSEIILTENLPVSIRENVRNIQTASQNLLSSVSDVLDFSELNSGKLTLTEYSYNISSTVNDIINFTRGWKGNRDIELIIDMDSTIPSGLIGDEQKIKRIILNFLSNAYKFTTEGAITISISYRKEYYGLNLMVSVRDTGIGMDADNLENLFNSFSQIDSKRNRQEGGIGLGLAISQRLVELMGGFIGVESNIGEGTEIQFVIPQKIEDEIPIASCPKAKEHHVLIYMTMRQFDIQSVRNDYNRMIRHMLSQFQVDSHLCSNIDELKRRISLDTATHVFVGIMEYMEDKDFFNEMSTKLPVVVILDEEYEPEITSESVIRIYKPFYVLPLISILNGDVVRNYAGVKTNFWGRFIAPEAHILVVDDNEMNLRVIEGLLRPYQIKITTCLSGAEALEKIESKKFDLVFMDHMMPDMDGIETLERIRIKKGRYYDEIPIIAVTANAVAGAKEMFLESGFQGFIPKPIEVSVLDRALRQFLPEKTMIHVDDLVNLDEENNIHTEEIEKKDFSISIEVPPVVTKKSGGSENGLNISEIDVEQGIKFCGSYNDLLDILTMNVRNYSKTLDSLNTYFENEDIKNYTISIHGLKSSMKMIGVNDLSEMARLLEMAAKASDMNYIRENHKACMDEYSRIIHLIYNEAPIDVEGINIDDNDINTSSETTIDISTLTVLSDDEYRNILSEFENAAYSWDEGAVRDVLDKLKGKAYNGRAFEEIMQSIQNKIEMSDYMSALNLLEKF